MEAVRLDQVVGPHCVVHLHVDIEPPLVPVLEPGARVADDALVSAAVDGARAFHHITRNPAVPPVALLGGDHSAHAVRIY